jgi:hypothetical protein
MKLVRILGLVAVTVMMLHFVLGYVLAGSDFMVALAAARHGQVGSSLLFALLLMVRLVGFVMVPPLFVAGLCLVVYDHLAQRRG